ncbi:MAG: hypothetical protein AAB480_01290 [Patescibacteria group bacterium]
MEDLMKYQTATLLPTLCVPAIIGGDIMAQETKQPWLFGGD